MTIIKPEPTWDNVLHIEQLPIRQERNQYFEEPIRSVCNDFEDPMEAWELFQLGIYSMQAKDGRFLLC